MDLQRFFEHWKLKEHPFQAEEALSDSVYNRMMEAAITHPDFMKIYGDPANPATTIVFGEKGSGKTAIRLMIQSKLSSYNQGRKSDKAWVVCYDELNPMLDRLSRHLKTEDGEKIMETIRLSDHQDAIMSIAVTELIDEVLDSDDKDKRKQLAKTLRKMNSQKRKDLSILALLYDQPKHGQASDRWRRLCQILRIGTIWDRSGHGFVIAFALIIGLVGGIGGIGLNYLESPGWMWMIATVLGLGGAALLGISWLMRDWRNSRLGGRLNREIRVVVKDKDVTCRQLWDFTPKDIAAQPFPSRTDQDSRYDLTNRFVRVIEELGYTSLIALVDRVDEPGLVNGDAKRMKLLLWPMLNNKFLQQERIGIKMLLPIELGHMLIAEEVEFKRKARLDKQNMINPLKWTGITLYDLCSWRFKNCRKTSDGNETISLDALFEDEVNSNYLIEALDQMHQPRDAFKFLYAVVLEHCRNTPGDSENFQISKSTLDHVRREQSQRVVDLYRGVGSN